MNRTIQLLVVWLGALGMGCAPTGGQATSPAAGDTAPVQTAMAAEKTARAGAEPAAAGEKTMNRTTPEKITRTDEEWRKLLTPEQYHVLREKGTERAFTGAFWNNHEKGLYLCAACGQELFSSSQKYDSGSGWPSFWQPTATENVATERDRSLGMARTEITCSRCGSHLGHVFEDGPEPTGLRYCVNSASLKFVPGK